MITLDLASPTPPYEQIRGQLVDLIRSGALDAGRRLPSIRQLAADLRIAPGAVAKAYKQLEAAGFIESSRAAGTRVRTGQQADETLRLAAQTYAALARRNDASLDDALSVVRTAWDLG